jgi:hypothetical protein
MKPEDAKTTYPVSMHKDVSFPTVQAQDGDCLDALALMILPLVSARCTWVMGSSG